jgi:hypothetical protein
VEKLKLSHSKISTFLHCRQRYAWSYVEELVPKEKAFPLQVGDILHQLLDLWYTDSLEQRYLQDMEAFVRDCYPNNTSEQTLEVAYQALRLFNGYYTKFAESDPLNFVSSETHIEVDMGDYILVMRVDALARPKDGRLWRVEHKTTARLDSHYLNGLKGGLQGAIYDFGVEHMLKEKVEGTIYNLLVKTKEPQYHRAYTKRNLAAQERMLKTVEGVYRDITKGDFYPSSQCYQYARECPYLLLCNHDSKEAREAFYEKKVSGDSSITNVKEEGGE